MSFLDEWLALRGSSQEDIRKRFKITAIDPEANYNGLKNVTMMENPGAFPGKFYFKEGQLVLIYVASSKDLDEDDLLDKFGTPEAELKLRAGKRFTQYVYPEQGVAFSGNGDEVVILEIFPPMTLDEYKTTLYKDPGKFYK